MKTKPMFLLFFLAGLLILSASCGATGENPVDFDALLDSHNPVVLEIWHYYNGPQKVAFDQMITEFNETKGLEKGIMIEAFSQGNVSELLGKVLDAANRKVGAGSVPDIFAAYADTAYAMDQLGLVAALDPYFTEAELAQYRQEYLAEGRFDGENNLKIFPTAKSVELLMLNKTDWDPFAAANAVTLEDLTTLEGLVTVAEKYYHWTDSLTAEPEDGKAFFGRDSLSNYFVIGAKQLDLEILGGTQAYTLDEAVIRRLWDNYYVPYIQGYFGAFGRFRSDDVRTGDILAFAGSSTGAVYFPDAVALNDTQSYPIECLMLPAPHFAGGGAFAVQQGAGLVVTKSNAKTEYAAAIFLKWFTETERNLAFAVDSAYLPVKNEALTPERFQQVLAQKETSPTQDRIALMLASCLDVMDTHSLFTNQASAGGTAARNVLGTILSDKASSDRRAVLNLMAGGLSREEAVAQYNTNENFQNWYQQLDLALRAAVE